MLILFNLFLYKLFYGLYGILSDYYQADTLPPIQAVKLPARDTAGSGRGLRSGQGRAHRLFQSAASEHPLFPEARASA
jgi:hypothetical protein